MATLRRQAYEYIQNRIAAGDLTAGQVLSEHALAREIGVSRTPVREALRQLESEGLLEPSPHQGSVVRRPDRRDLVELFELREALESYAARQAASRVTDAERQRLKVLCDELDRIERQAVKRRLKALDPPLLRAFLAADLGFHSVLIQAGGNRRVIKIVNESRVLAQVFAAPRQLHSLEVVRETCRFHAEILQAVTAGDPVSAASAMARHIRASLQRALECYDRESVPAPAPTSEFGLPLDLARELDRIERRAAQTVPKSPVPKTSGSKPPSPKRPDSKRAVASPRS